MNTLAFRILLSRKVPRVNVHLIWGPCGTVAANVAAENEVWLKSGALLDAIRASISVPMFFAPHVVNGEELIDGGVLNPVPIAPTFGDNTDVTVTVNLSGDLRGLHKKDTGFPDDKRE